MKLEKLLQNKNFLYFLVFLAVTQVIGYLMVKDDYSVALFLSFSLLASLFTKNMIVILSAGILGTNLYKVISASRRSYEGMAGRRSEEGLENEDEDDEDDDAEDEEPEEIESSEQADKNFKKAMGDLTKNLNALGMDKLSKDPEVKKAQENLQNKVKKLEPFLGKVSKQLGQIAGATDFKEGYGSTGGARKKRKY
jgi:hypothetical protein